MRFSALNMQGIKLSVPQKKIIVISFIVIMVFLIFFIFIYLPSKATVVKIKAELLSQEKQIQEIEAIVKKAKTQEEGIRLLRDRFKKLDNKFPRQEEEALKALSDLARKLNVELVSLKPEPKEAFVDQDNKKIEIEGRYCQVIPVSLEMRCLYKDLVRYLRALRESLPAFATVEVLKINKNKAQALKLNVTLSINLYILS